jgi:hypothetical protein
VPGTAAGPERKALALATHAKKPTVWRMIALLYVSVCPALLYAGGSSEHFQKKGTTPVVKAASSRILDVFSLQT